MSLGNATLGCDPVYEIGITSSCSNSFLQLIPNICKYKYNRRLDKISQGQVSFAVDSDCNDIAESICLGRHSLTFKRNGCVEWKGPIRRMEFADDQINLFASDPLWWTTRRVAPPFYASPIGVDSVDTGVSFATPAEYFNTRILDLFSLSTDDWAVANNLASTDYTSDFDDCPEDFNPMCFRQIVSADGVLPAGAIEILTRKSLKYTTLDKVLNELAKNVIDYTVVGDTLLFGYPSTPIPAERSQPTPTLSNSSWCNPPRIVKDITALTSEVFVNTKIIDEALSSVEGTVYENGTVRVQDCGFSKHGYHQSVIEQTSIASLEEATAAGESHLEHNNNTNSVTYIENTKGTQLDQNVSWDLPRMIPGMDVYVNVNEYGLQVNQTMRLHEVIVEGSPSLLERVKVTLEPTGVS